MTHFGRLLPRLLDVPRRLGLPRLLRLLRLLWWLPAWLGAAAALAQDLRPPLLLTAASSRDGLDLSGRWTYSLDWYRTGLTDINGWVAKSRMQRHRDVDIAAEEAKAGTGFFEFDLDRGPAMQIPGAWNAAAPELRYYDGLIWFQRRFDLAALPAAGQRSFLRFEAVNHSAQVWLNGREVGRHEGGFTPFVLEVTGLLRTQGNRLTVAADSRRNAQSIPAEITDWDLHGGITRPVTLIHTPATFIDDATLRLTEAGRLVGSLRLNGPQAARRPVTLAVDALNLRVVAETDERGEVRFDTAAPAGLKRWSPESPTLYSVQFSTAGDQTTDRIGFRTVAVRGAQILLNGEPVFLRGVSLHEEEFGPNPARRLNEPAARALLHEVKHGLHGNYVRLSHYPHSEAMLKLADEMGLLVWSEIPVYWSVDWDNPSVLQKALRMQAETIYRDRNRAALVLWSIGNETPVAEPRTRFHAALAKQVRALDPSRLVSAALLVERKNEPHGSGTRPVIRIADPLLPLLDVAALNTYAGWYGDDRLADLPNLRWELPADKPLVISEFGADALAGHHDRHPNPALAAKYSEEFQAAYYRATLAMIERLPTLTGLSPWVLKDFRSPRREHPVFQNGWNRKGLLSETGQRKQAFEVMAAWYRAKAGSAAPVASMPAIATVTLPAVPALAANTSGTTGTTATATTPMPFDLAITVDDLPTHGALPPGVTRLQVAQSHLRTFGAMGVGEAWGFVNSAHLATEPEGEALLSAWRRAGHPLGNHAHTHLHLDRAPTLEAWLADVDAVVPALERHAGEHSQGRDWRWFRYPYLGNGSEPARRDGALAALRQRGYRIADVSLSFDDWAYTDAHARCLARGDAQAVATLRRQYLAEVDAEIARTLALSLAVHGRVIPQVLLAHLGAFSADTLAEVLERLQRAGARFVPLAQVQSDAAYARPGGGSVIERAARDKGITIPPRPPRAVDPDKVCR